MKCEYGCGQEAKFKTSNDRWCCSSFYSKCPALKKKCSASLKKAHKDGKIPGWGKLWKEGKVKSWSKDKTKFSDARLLKDGESIEKIFTEDCKFPRGYIRRIILKEKLIEYKCGLCSIDKWNNKPLTLQLDHKNGDNRNSLLSNLRFLCPNCHSQTPTYVRGSSERSIQVSDKILLKNIHQSKSIRDALIKSNLPINSSNYFRVKKLMDENFAGMA